MKNNFDLKKFLIENKITSNSKMFSEAQASKELQNFGKEVHKKLQIIKAFKFHRKI